MERLGYVSAENLDGLVDGNVFFFEGSYTDYEINKAKRLGLEEPKRIRYRKLDD